MLLSTNNIISDMAIDNNGLVWITTIGGDGLYHYTGNEFSKVAYLDYGTTDSTSLASVRLTSLTVDEENNLWIGTFGSGVEYYNALTNQFSHFRHDSLNEASICGDTVIDVHMDQLENLWVGTSQGLSIKKKGQTNFKTYFLSYSIANIHEDNFGRIWVSFGHKYDTDEPGGLVMYDVKSEAFETIIPVDSTFENFTPFDGTFKSFGQLFVASDQVVYVAIEDKGIARLDIATKAISYPTSLQTDPALIQDDGSNVLFKDEDERIWIGSFAGGLSLYDPTSDTIINRYGLYLNGSYQFQFHPGSNDFNTQISAHIYEPEYGIFWVGSSGGVFAIKKKDTYQIPFHEIPFLESNTMFLQRNVLFIGTTTGGLMQKNLTTGETRVWNDSDEADFPIKGLQTIWGLRVDKLSQTIWMGSVGNGLYKVEYSEIVDYPFYSPIRIVNYPHNSSIENTIPSNVINGMIIDRDGLIWLATEEGLASFDPLKESFTTYTFKQLPNQSKPDNELICVDEGFGGAIWVGGSRGISRLNKETGDFTTYAIGDVRDIYVDHFGVIWAGNRSGMYYYDRQSKDFLRLTVEDVGIEIRNVIGILEDWDSNLWITTKNQIIRLDEQREKTLVFGTNQGVSYNQMGWQDNHLGHDDKIFIGHHAGYYYIDPKDYQSLEISEPILNLSSFKLGNEAVRPGQGSILEKPLNETEALYLTHHQNTFSLAFTGADYYFNKSPDFRFKLEGYNTDWNELGNDNQVFFFQVPPDEYTLKIMATNEAGLVTRREIGIYIDRPWWLKAWAVLVYIFAFCTLIIAIDRIQRRRTLLKERERVKDKRLAQAVEIERAYEKLRETQSQLIHSEKMASLGELTAGIAHEIQNPLNFVNNFSELSSELVDEMVEELEKGDADEAKAISSDIKDNLAKINHHGKRADAIVKGMLQHSRAGSGEKELTDINALADEYLRLAYHGLRAKDKSFNADFKAELDPNLPKVSVIPQDIGRVLLNLINNAFQALSTNPSHPEPVEGDGQLQGLDSASNKDTLRQAQRDTPMVIVSTKAIPPSKGGQGDFDTIQITVSDNGPGIPEAIKEKIFQPFFTTKPTGSGTGLGLSLSYDIVKAHGGELKVDTSEGVGSEFIIQLPIV